MLEDDRSLAPGDLGGRCEGCSRCSFVATVEHQQAGAAQAVDLGQVDADAGFVDAGDGAVEMSERVRRPARGQQDFGRDEALWCRAPRSPSKACGDGPMRGRVARDHGHRGRAIFRGRRHSPRTHRNIAPDCSRATSREVRSCRRFQLARRQLGTLQRPWGTGLGVWDFEQRKGRFAVPLRREGGNHRQQKSPGRCRGF
jgi:hypothetical protein